MMKPDRWQQIDALLQSTLEQRPEDRMAYLDSACAGDAELQGEVQSLLDHHEQVGTSIENLPGEIAAQMVEQEPNALEPGQRVAHYRILSLLGSGGMGEVYLAEDATLGRQVALKLLPLRFTQDSDRVLRFEREARAVSALNHPNIVTIHQIGEIDGAHFLVTEFIEGQTLRQRMAAGRLKLDEALDIAIQVASALDSAHRAGIVHRDIKPENIMLRPDGLVKVLDFGLAKLTESPLRSDMQEAQTDIGVLMGSTPYMSPEQARGHDVDSRTDIFSLAVVLYEIVAGRAPFAGPTTGDILAAILKEEPAPLAPPELERIVRGALSKEREARFATAREFQAALKQYQQELQKDHSPLLSRRRLLWIGGTAVAAFSGLTTWRFWPDDAGIRKLAVLPFANPAHDNDAEGICNGITNGLIYSLQQVPSYRVAAFSTVAGFKDRNVSPRDAASQLDASYLLSGSVTQQDGRILISAKLVEANTGAKLWNDQYPVISASDLYGIPDKIVSAISDVAIPAAVSEFERRQLAQRPTSSPEAWELYRRGRRQQELETETGYRKALELFQKAVAADTKFALAFSEAAATCTSMAVDGYENPIDIFEQQRSYVERAQELDLNLPGVHSELGAHAFFFERNWKLAERELKLSIQPSSAYVIDPHYFFPYALERWALGHAAEGLELARTAAKDNPRPGFVALEANLLVTMRKTDKAISIYKDLIARNPGDPRAYSGLEEAYRIQGRFDDAIEVRRHAVDNGPEPAGASFRNLLTSARGAEGYRHLIDESARQLLKQLENRDAHGDYVSQLDFARVYARLGDFTTAFKFLDEALDERSSGLVFLNVDPVWDAIRGDSRFQAVVDNVGLPHG